MAILSTASQVRPESIPLNGTAQVELTVTAGPICNPRQFSARDIVNYVDTDFTCCEAQPQTVCAVKQNRRGAYAFTKS